MTEYVCWRSWEVELSVLLCVFCCCVAGIVVVGGFAGVPARDVVLDDPGDGLTMTELDDADVDGDGDSSGVVGRAGEVSAERDLASSSFFFFVWYFGILRLVIL